MSESAQAQALPIRVQVIDLDPRVLDLTVPTYLPARDLTQRIARDAGLDVHWSDGRRRRYWVRARGRILAEEERLSDVGVVSGELIHLLPEPPSGEGVREQRRDVPPQTGFRPSTAVALGLQVLVLIAWTVAWGLALSVTQAWWVALLPGLALGLLASSVGMRVFGGHGGQLQVLGLGIVIAGLLAVLAQLPALLYGVPTGDVVPTGVIGLVSASLGGGVGWLAWWGAVDPLPASAHAAASEQPAEAVQTAPCGICGLGVELSVQEGCRYGCGKVFHRGCYQARMAVVHGDQAEQCQVCGAALTH